MLLKQKITLADIEPLLGAFKIVRTNYEFEKWEFSGPSFLVEYRPEMNGYVSVDIVDRPWPDHMGDPKTEHTLFGAWGMGHFGPFAFPQGLERAGQHSNVCEQGPQFAAQHQGFIRIRISYGFGAADDAPVIPKDCKPVDELSFITRLAMELLRHPVALCYFNPNGELLAERPFMEQVIEHYRAANLPPIDLWTNRRRFILDSGWTMMDTVGMQQLDLQDIETCFRNDRFTPYDVRLFLANTSLYLTGPDAVFKDGETIDGPSGIFFRVKQFKEGMLAPPRSTLRFRPEDSTTPPPEFGFDIVGTKRKWQFWR